MRCKLAKGQVTGNREMSMCKALLTSTLFLSIISTHLENILQCGISCFNLSRRDISSFFFVLFFVFGFIFSSSSSSSCFRLYNMVWISEMSSLLFEEPLVSSFHILQTVGSYFLRRLFFRQALCQFIQPLKSMFFFTCNHRTDT